MTALATVPKTAMVLAAGLGTRMAPLTLRRPKALVPVQGRPLIDWVLGRLGEAGVERAIVNVHHFADLLEAHLRARSQAPAIEISDERAELLETGGALVKAKDRLGDEPIFVANIDSVWIEAPGARPAVNDLVRRWDGQEMDALLLLAPVVASIGYDGQGDFVMDPEGRLARRPFARRAPFAYTGVQIFHPRLVEGFAPGRFSLNRMWDRALDAGRLFGLRLQGEWMHVGDPAARVAAEARLSEIDAARR